ncbi:MAG: hypothetical protein JRH20_31385, partial [Deltaproteobacteria bacterium]|nr:hypothetical protein [Deltaproteobacteria bacterium]
MHISFRGWTKALLLAAISLTMGCVRTVNLHPAAGDVSPQDDALDFTLPAEDHSVIDASQLEGGGEAPIADSSPSFSSWAAYAASLDVPACVGALALEVNTTSVELDGGTALSDPANAGPTLSLMEAVQIAANRTERVAIVFSEAVFPPQSPSTISMDTSCSLPA